MVYKQLIIKHNCKSWILESESEQQTKLLSTHINADFLLFCQFCHGAKYQARITSTFSYYMALRFGSLSQKTYELSHAFKKESVTISPRLREYFITS